MENMAQPNFGEECKEELQKREDVMKTDYRSDRIRPICILTLPLYLYPSSLLPLPSFLSQTSTLISFSLCSGPDLIFFTLSHFPPQV